MPKPSSSSHLQAQNAWVQGQQLARQARWPEAVRRFELATRLQPADGLYWLNLTDALLKCGRHDQAVETARRGLRLDPESPLALTLMANALLMTHRHDELRDVLQSVPESTLNADLRGLLAQAHLETGDPQAAVRACMSALTQRPSDAGLHLKLGQAFKGLSMKAEAVECFRTATLLGLGPRQLAVHHLLAFHERELCDWQGPDARTDGLRQSIEALPDDAAMETNPFALMTLLDDPALQLKGVQSCARQVATLVKPLPARRPERRARLRLGYVSADFHAHATAYLMAELFERHDRSRFELFLYSHGRDDGSAMRQRLQRAADHFVEARGMGSLTLAERIRADGIDILVDLKGYTLEARPAVFAHRPAPVQAAYLGFPGTSGAPWIDYVIGDPVVTPLQHAPWFTEKIAQLPGCYQCNDGTRRLPVAPPRASQGLPEGALVLCGFNQPYKISPEVFDVWCRLLQRLPNAVLWLLGWSVETPPALRREAASRGVDPGRIVFAPTVSQSEHLDRIACADLFLDTWPCNGHTTASDMLWAGVPVVTFSGRTFASRVAGSLLHAVGLPELVCEDVASYESLALALASDAPRRQALAARLAVARRSSPLFSSAHLAPQLEALYERMWARALAGLPPEHLPAEAVAPALPTPREAEVGVAA